MKTRVLVTGAAGFIGSYLIEYFLSAGYDDIWATTYDDSPWLLEKLGPEKVVKVNLTNSESVFPMIERVQPDWVIHLAALAFVGGSFSRATEVMNNNTTLQYVMLEAIRRFSPKSRVLSIGSAAEYGLLPEKFDSGKITEDFPLYPNNPYAVSKMTQDYLSLSYHLAYGLDIVRLRPFNQIGPRQTSDFVVPAFAQQIVKVERGEQPAVKVGNLAAIRDFTDVRDAVRVYELLLRVGEAGEVYNLGSGKGVSAQEILDSLIELATADIPVEVDPERLRPVDVPVFVADNQKITALGWKPHIPLAQTLADVLEYERKR